MEKINKQYDKLQDKYGSKQLNSVYGAGCRQNAKVALVFMNPTKRNIATDKNWNGLKAQWLGTKQIWDFLTKCDWFDENLNKQLKSKRPTDWTEEFCEKVYAEVASKGVWLTNLAKCSQDDARPLPDEIFLQYRDLLKRELALVAPQKVLLFGNQVASIVLEEKVSVSLARCKKFDLDLNGNVVEGYAVFYPVGNGRFNQDKAICDIKTILTD